ncbi:MAG TPA: RNA polymerase sigma factor [Flavisolibacter sp.]|jgi:RNA polymerase sigma-70 factor (ECF subfamily)|nr:RNA polymerase sigma factor [Flavisolibacter sp.]
MSAQEFDSLVITNAEGLKPFAITLTRDRETAQDLYQETLFKAFANRDRYQSGTNIKAWLCTIMRNIFINDYRRNERKRLVHGSVQYTEKNNSYSLSAESAVRLREINNAIYNLPAIFRKVCLLYLQGYKYNEIADALNEPLGTIKSRIHFARKLLQKQIDR